MTATAMCQYCRTDGGKYPPRHATQRTPDGAMCPECHAEYREWKHAAPALGANDTLAD
jgi:hypothetical protein